MRRTDKRTDKKRTDKSTDKRTDKNRQRATLLDLFNQLGRHSARLRAAAVKHERDPPAVAALGGDADRCGRRGGAAVARLRHRGVERGRVLGGAPPAGGAPLATLRASSAADGSWSTKRTGPGLGSAAENSAVIDGSLHAACAGSTMASVDVSSGSRLTTLKSEARVAATLGEVVDRRRRDDALVRGEHVRADAHQKVKAVRERATVRRRAVVPLRAETRGARREASQRGTRTRAQSARAPRGEAEGEPHRAL